MGGSRCVVGGCSNKRSGRISLHQFPKDSNIKCQWVRVIKATGTNVSRVAWNGPSDSKSINSQLVCSEHFEIDCFTITTRLHWQQGIPYKAKLNEDAVPSLFGDQIQEYKSNGTWSEKPRGAFRKRELGRIISEYDGDSRAATALPEVQDSMPGGVVEETQTTVNVDLIPGSTEKDTCQIISEDTDSAATQTECLSGDTSTVFVEDGSTAKTTSTEVEDMNKGCKLCDTVQTQPKMCEAEVQVMPSTTVKATQVSRKPTNTTVVKGTQTLLRHTIKMKSSYSQYNASDCKTDVCPDETASQHDLNTAAKCSTPAKTKLKVPVFSPLNLSFQSTSSLYFDDRETDSDYQPDGSFHSETAEECHEQRNPVSMRKFLVFEDNLLQLFSTCLMCGQHTEANVCQIQGTYAAVRQSCECGHSRRWESQPKVNGIPAGNLLLSAGILFSGCCATKFLRVLNFLNIMTITLSTFFDHQRKILWPAIETTWHSYNSILLKVIKDRGGKVVVAGDGRADSPGHCAKYGAYSLIDMDSGQVIGLHLVQSNEVKSSYHMELEGLKRAVRCLNEAGISILEIVTDRHLQIQKWIRENLISTIHSFDVWHIAKGVKKKLMALAKEKECQDVSKWIKSITNHLYWTAASSREGDGELMVSKWKSVSGHVQNVHHGHEGQFKKCQHETLLHRVWLKPGSKAAVKVEGIVCSKHLCTAVGKMSTGFQTSTLEAFHSVINHFAPKMTSYSYYGQLCRQHLAALHFNENIQRNPLKSKDGTPQLKISHPKFKTMDDYSVKVLTSDMTFQYVEKLLATTLTMSGENNSMTMPAPPPLTTGKRKPSKQEALLKMSTRYKKLKF